MGANTIRYRAKLPADCEDAPHQASRPVGAQPATELATSFAGCHCTEYLDLQHPAMVRIIHVQESRLEHSAESRGNKGLGEMCTTRVIS